MADAPNPHGAHEHLFHHHLLAQARADAARTSSPCQVWCVICGGAAAIESAARGGAGHPWAPQPGEGEEEVAAPVGVERVEVAGHVEGAWATSQRGAWRVSISGRIVFARQSDGCVQALQAAARSGDQVRVATRRIRADLWADAVHWC